jgi:hypothetical protein
MNNMGHRAVYDAQSKVEAKLSTVLKEKNWNWNWKPARSKALVTFKANYQSEVGW